MEATVDTWRLSSSQPIRLPSFQSIMKMAGNLGIEAYGVKNNGFIGLALEAARRDLVYELRAIWATTDGESVVIIAGQMDKYQAVSVVSVAEHLIATLPKVIDMDSAVQDPDISTAGAAIEQCLSGGIKTNRPIPGSRLPDGNSPRGSIAPDPGRRGCNYAC